MVSANVEQKIQSISVMIDSIVSDYSIPRNVRNIIAEGKKRLNSKEEFSLALSTSIYELDEIANDINIPMHARSQIWNVISEMEKLKEAELK